MKISISGKGGVGKTTLAACLAKYFFNAGFKVIAVDADPDANLASGLGIDFETASKIKPLVEMSKLIEERTGSVKGEYGGYFKLNPKVDDIPGNFSIDAGGIKLLIAGTVKSGGSGCYCPENTFLKRLFRFLVVESKEVVILDMEAGIEHLGRGTTENMDALIIVVEPGLRSIQTAISVKKLASEIGIRNIFVVINKLRNKAEEETIRQNLTDLKVLGVIPYLDSVKDADLLGISPCENSEDLKDSISVIASNLQKYVSDSKK
jgi:CO dehydrogenase maturation factor